MPQRHMSYDDFVEIINGLPKGIKKVSLQGEGEPMLNKAFFIMASLVKSKGYEPYTITNGTVINENNITKIPILFEKIGVSIDSLSDIESRFIGRTLNKKVIDSIGLLKKVLPSRNIIIHTVDYGQDIKPLSKWCRDMGLGHFIQPLQQKEDYAINYDKV